MKGYQMSSRKRSPLHDYWHPRVEGQIRHTIGQHPEWFAFKSPVHQRACVISLAKRIVGEIVAACTVATIPDGMAANCVETVGSGSAADVLPPGRDGDAHCCASGNPMIAPDRKGTQP
jgi:hypothetical protein